MSTELLELLRKSLDAGKKLADGRASINQAASEKKPTGRIAYTSKKDWIYKILDIERMFWYYVFIEQLY